MNTYICENHRPAQAEWIKDAGYTFAQRKARMEYGRNATVGEFKMEFWSEDGLRGEFEAYVGIKTLEQTAGHNVRFSVYRVTYQEEK